MLQTHSSEILGNTKKYSRKRFTCTNNSSSSSNAASRALEMSSKGLLSFLVYVSLTATAQCNKRSAFVASSNSICTSVPKHVNTAMTAPTFARNHPAGNPLRPKTPASVAWGSGVRASSNCIPRLEGQLGGRRLIKSGCRTSQRLVMKAASTKSELSGGGEGSQAPQNGARSVNWPLWYVLPIAPYQRRKTLMEEIVPGKVRTSILLLVWCMKASNAGHPLSSAVLYRRTPE